MEYHWLAPMTFSPPWIWGWLRLLNVEVMLSSLVWLMALSSARSIVLLVGLACPVEFFVPAHVQLIALQLIDDALRVAYTSPEVVPRSQEKIVNELASSKVSVPETFPT